MSVCVVGCEECVARGGFDEGRDLDLREGGGKGNWDLFFSNFIKQIISPQKVMSPRSTHLLLKLE